MVVMRLAHLFETAMQVADFEIDLVDRFPLQNRHETQGPVGWLGVLVQYRSKLCQKGGCPLPLACVRDRQRTHVRAPGAGAVVSQPGSPCAADDRQRHRGKESAAS